MRIRIHRDIARLVDANRAGIRSANQEVNLALATYYAMKKPRRKVIKL